MPNQLLSTLTLLLVASLCLTPPPLDENNRLLLNRNNQKRTLAEGGVLGDYTIIKDYASTCDDFTGDEIIYTDAEFNEGHDLLKEYFTFLQEPLREYLKTEDTQTLQDVGKKQYWILINAIFMIFSLFMFIFFIFYFFLKACCACLCCCCDDDLDKDLAEKPKDSQAERQTKARKRAKRRRRIKKLSSKGCTGCVVITSLLLVAGILALGIAWDVYIFRTITGIQRTDCATSYFFSDVKNGLKTDKLTFAGLRGIESLFNTIKTDIGAIPATTIHTLGLNTLGNDLKTAVTTFASTRMSQEVASCTGTGNIKPDVTETMTDNINEPIKIQADALAQVANQIHDMGVTADDIQSGQVAEYQGNIDELLTQITDAKSNIEKFETTFRDSMDIEANIKYARWGAWVIMLGTAALLILFILLMVCSLNNICTSLTTFFEALLAIFKMLFAFLINALALVSIVIGIITVNICVIAHDALNDKTLAHDLFPEDVHQMFDICLDKDGSGDLLELVGAGDAFTQLESIQGLTDTLNIDLSEYSFTTAPSDTPISLYNTEFLAKWNDLSLPGFASNLDHGPEKQILIGNDVVKDCTQDKWVLNESECPADYTKSLDGDGESEGLGTKYCMIMNQFNNDIVTTRYGSGSCGGSVTDEWANTKICTKALKILTDSFITDYSTNVQIPADAVYNGINDATGDFNALKTEFIKSVNFISDSVGSFPELMNCKIVRNELRNMLGNTCYTFTRPFILQAIILAIIGPLMSVLACCVCCTFMQSKSKSKAAELEKAEKKHQKYKDAQQNNNNQMNMNQHPNQQRGGNYR